MKSIRILLLLTICFFRLVAAPAQTAEDYAVSPDSKPQPGVPKGEVLKFTFENSKIFPGTWREYWAMPPLSER